MGNLTAATLAQPCPFGHSQGQLAIHTVANYLSFFTILTNLLATVTLTWTALTLGGPPPKLAAAATVYITVVGLGYRCSRSEHRLHPGSAPAMTEGDARNLAERNLRSVRSPDQHAAHLVDVVPEVALITDIDGIPLSAFDVLRNVLSADARGHRGLHIGDGKPIAGSLAAVYIDIHIESLRNLFRENRTQLRQACETFKAFMP